MNAGRWYYVTGARDRPTDMQGSTVRSAHEPAPVVAAGRYLDPSALRRRYRRAQQAAGLRPLCFHDLRHSFGSLVIREFDPVSVKDFMGHAKITTTERYLHARSRRTDAARMMKAFAPEPLDLASTPA